MEYSLEEYEEVVESVPSVAVKSNGLGFLGGPTWHYPEEEIKFYPIDEVVDEESFLDEDSDIESCSLDSFRLAMIENYIENHDIVDEDFDLFYGLSNVDYALSQPPPSVMIDRDNSSRKHKPIDSDLDDHHKNIDSAQLKPPPSIIIERDRSIERKIMGSDMDDHCNTSNIDNALLKPPPSIIIKRDSSEHLRIIKSDLDDHCSTSNIDDALLKPPPSIIIKRDSSEHFRIAKSELEDHCSTSNIDTVLSTQPPPSVIIKTDSSENLRNSESDLEDHFSTSGHTSSSRWRSINENEKNNSVAPIISPLSLEKRKKPTSWLRPSTKRRRQQVSISSETTIREQKFELYREATVCVPFEYTTKLATFYIRRPYGFTTVPEVFRSLSPHVTEEEYERKAQVSSSKTIQVAISISADKSTMLLHGPAGVRYKKNAGDPHREKWIDVPDVGLMDVPLGYVSTGNRNSEYSLDEILEEAMFVREQYCNTIVSAALQAEQRQLMGSVKKAPSPPSLAKSIVSTPSRNNYYYDGSSNVDTKVEEDQEEIKGRKLDFMHCLSPSLMTKGSIGTATSSNQPLKQRKKRRRKQAYRFLQRVVMVIGFYICGIILVGNLSGVENHLPSTFVAELVPPPYKTVLQTFLNTREEKIQVGSGDHKTAIAEQEEQYASTQKERDMYKRNLETTQELLREQEGQNSALSKKFDLERTKIEELQKGKEDAVALVQNLLQETETLAAGLEIEQGQRQKLEQTVRELEMQIQNLMHEKSSMEAALEAETLKPGKITNPEESSEVIVVEFMDATNVFGENRSLPDSIVDETPERRRENKVEIFASSLKSAITKKVNRIVRSKNQGVSKDDQSEMDKLRDTLNNPFMAQHSLKFIDDNAKIREMLKTSTENVLKHSKEVFKHSKDGSDLLARNVKKNVDDVSIAGIKKMDQGQEAIKVVGEFAKAKLQSVGKRARLFASKKWKRVRKSA